MSNLYAAAGALVCAQLVGLYALKTRKADLFFSIVMVVLVGVAIAFAILGGHALLHHL
jgi:hypothetical protein